MLRGVGRCRLLVVSSSFATSGFIAFVKLLISGNAYVIEEILASDLPMMNMPSVQKSILRFLGKMTSSEQGYAVGRSMFLL